MVAGEPGGTGINTPLLPGETRIGLMGVIVVGPNKNVPDKFNVSACTSNGHATARNSKTIRTILAISRTLQEPEQKMGQPKRRSTEMAIAGPEDPDTYAENARQQRKSLVLLGNMRSPSRSCG
jgi:hypothetical protein